MPTLLALALDVAAVFVFALIGRSSHAEALDAPSVLRVAAPFLAGLLMGWVALLLKRFTADLLRQGLILLGTTVVLGMLFRALLRDGVQVSFVAVATAALAVLLLGWRAVAWAVLRRRAAAR